MSTHYDTLGIQSSASDTQIRDAYRRLARKYHPDRQASAGSTVSSASMPAINEAYRVLNDPARRAVYDAGLRPSASAPRPEDSESASEYVAPVHPSHLGPARFPWRGMLVAGTIGIIGVVVLAQFTKPGEPSGPDGILGVDSCVVIETNGFAREVLCTRDAAVDLVVTALVPFDATCPGRTEPHQDRQGMGIACITKP
ncbi:MAG TPA: J domain-containing protein [Ilumatobacteraceae bacterium]|nr:J domain-containing protein [Ilumatobacteraceae bacterium]